MPIKGTEDDGGEVNYTPPNDQQDVCDHFPIVVTLTTAGTTVTINQIKAKIEAIQAQLDELKAMGEQLENPVRLDWNCSFGFRKRT